MTDSIKMTPADAERKARAERVAAYQRGVAARNNETPLACAEREAAEYLADALRRLQAACDPAQPAPGMGTASGSTRIVLGFARTAMAHADRVRIERRKLAKRASR